MRKLIIGCFCILAFAACKKQAEELSSPALADYFPLKVGKYNIYRLDSMVLTAFGASMVTHSYRAKDVVDEEITDALGRKAYRIFRYITDTNGVAPYRSAATYMAIPNGTDWIEYVDNNLRFMKLRWPIREVTQWKGNSFITDPSSPSYYADWTYQYDSIAKPYTLLGKTYDSTIIVRQRNDATSDGPPLPDVYQQKNYSVERYGKGIGLIYKEFLHYVWQPSTSSLPAHYEDDSYGLRLRLIDHN